VRPELRFAHQDRICVEIDGIIIIQGECVVGSFVEAGDGGLVHVVETEIAGWPGSHFFVIEAKIAAACGDCGFLCGRLFGSKSEIIVTQAEIGFGRGRRSLGLSRKLVGEIEREIAGARIELRKAFALELVDILSPELPTCAVSVCANLAGFAKLTEKIFGDAQLCCGVFQARELLCHRIPRAVPSHPPLPLQ
jgi:hypothetical protein